MARDPKRLYGPAQLGNSAATVYTVPAATKTIIRSIHLQNPPGGSNRTVTISIGSDAAGTRVYREYPIATGQVIPIWTYFVLEAGEVLQAYADGASAVVITVDGDEIGQITYPIDISGLVLWLDASDASTINAGSPANNDPVTTWADKSDSGFDASQSTSNNKPTYKTNQLSGLPGVQFDPSGTARHMTLSGAGSIFQAVDGFTIATVMPVSDALIASPAVQGVFTASINGGAGIRGGIVSASQAIFLAACNVDAGGFTDYVSFSPLQTTGGASPAVKIFLFIGRVNLLSADIRHNQIEYDDWTFNDTPGATPNTTSTTVKLGSYPDASNPLDNTLHELVVYDRMLTALETRQLSEYLSEKWTIIE